MPTLGGHPLLRQGVACKISSPLDPKKTEVKNLPNKISGSEPITFTVLPKDTDGKPISDVPLEVTVIDPQGNENILKPDFTSGVFNIHWLPKRPGKHTVTVNAKGTVLVDHHPIEVEEHTSPEHSAMTIQKIVNISVLVRAFNQVAEPRRKGGDKTTISIKGPSGAVDYTVHDNNDGTYTVNFMADKPGDYEVHGAINGKSVKGSPLHYKVTDFPSYPNI